MLLTFETGRLVLCWNKLYGYAIIERATTSELP